MASQFRGTREQIEKVLRALPAALAGGPDPLGVALQIQLAAGVSLLGQIEQDFVTKSRGGQGRDGIKWKKLYWKTIAVRGINKRDASDKQLVKGVKVPNRNSEASIQARFHALWQSIYQAKLAGLRMVMGQREAQKFAAEAAWNITRALGNRTVDIGKDTGKLLRSFAAGQGGPSGPDQFFQTPPGKVIVGTNVPYAPKFAEVRPFWPPGGKIPAAWATEIVATIQRAVVKAVVLIASKGA